MTGYYPYPRLADLEHYGDWPAPVSPAEIPPDVPEAAKSNRIGAFWYQRMGNGKFFIQMLAVNGQEWKDSTTPRLLSAAVIEAPAGWESWRTVSYTHLDVYKRQRSRFPRSSITAVLPWIP